MTTEGQEEPISQRKADYKEKLTEATELRHSTSPVSITNDVKDLIMGLLTQAWMRNEIVREVHNEYPGNYTDQQIKSLIEMVKDDIIKATDHDLLSIILYHIYCYERLYKKFMDIGDRGGARRSMKQKELVMGLVSEEIALELYQNTSGFSGENSLDEEYDLSKLTPTERSEFDLLLFKISNNNETPLAITSVLPQERNSSTSLSSPLDSFLAGDQRL